jgi:23S rRNA (cytidine2498-2'-O)-methyltransferase
MTESLFPASLHPLPLHPIVSAPAPFVFATCREGSERLLKAEVARRHEGLLTPAFMRPQFVTWKATRELPPGFELGGVFGRTSGLSVGLFQDEKALVRNLGELAGDRPFHLHVFPRDCHEDGVTILQWADIDILRARLVGLLRDSGLPVPVDGKPRNGDLVFDVVVGEGKEEPLFLGRHQHSINHHPMHGGLPRLELPYDAPSRAWLKMEQALAWLGLDGSTSLQGQVVLELGSAPGGASFSLLHHGAQVYGVDTGVMDSDVLAFQDPKTGASFTHLRMAVGTLAPQHLPPEVDIVISDMNLAPGVVIPYLETICRRHRPALMILTMKMTDERVESRVGEILGSLRRFVPTPLRATQLPANRREICVVAGGLGAV